MEIFLNQLGLGTIDGYRFERRLSGGEMAAVAVFKRIEGRAAPSEPERVVVKFLIAPRWERELETFRREAETLMMLRKCDLAHTLVRGISTVRSSQNFPVHYFFMEYVEGTTLRSLFETEPLPWEEGKALEFIYRISTALIPAAGLAEVHRDLHAGNIMIVTPEPHPEGAIAADPGIRILDFGTSKNWLSAARENWQEDRFRHCGAVSAWSPEFIADPATVDSKHDVWALGNLLFRMLTGEYAFPAENFSQYYDLVRTASYSKACLDNCSYEVRRLVAAMFNTSPRERISLSGIRKISGDILHHNLGEWLRNRPILQELYFLVEGNIWTCPLCGATGNPASGSRCRSCRRYVDEFLSPF